MVRPPLVPSALLLALLPGAAAFLPPSASRCVRAHVRARDDACMHGWMHPPSFTQPPQTQINSPIGACIASTTTTKLQAATAAGPGACPNACLCFGMAGRPYDNQAPAAKADDAQTMVTYMHKYTYSQAHPNRPAAPARGVRRPHSAQRRSGRALLVELCFFRVCICVCVL